MRTLLRIGTCAVLGLAGLAAPSRRADAQAVLAAWGNIEGLRIAGQVIPFETSLCTVSADGRDMSRTAKERQQPRFTRAGNVRTVTTRLGALSFVETVEDVGVGEARVQVRVTADSATSASAYLCVDLPRTLYPVVTRTGAGSARATVPDSAPAQGITFASAGVPSRRVVLTMGAPSLVRVEARRERGGDDHRARLPLLVGPSAAGRTATLSVVIRASGDIDRRPVALTMDASREGREFVGMGGNFRIQNPTVDARVIQYNLANMRVAYGRVEMPWRLWHPTDSTDPSALQPSELNPRVRSALEMAKTIADRGAPVVVAVWFPPQWAVLGELPRGGQRVNGEWGNALDPAKMDAIYRSLGSYLVYLKRHYGVEVESFSFNESDLGIDVRQTAQEHNAFIKGFGAHVRSLGLNTKMLLGDVSDATPVDFIKPAMADSASWPYISAVSYHSWRGWSDSLLTYWSDAAKRLNVPLLVGEGSTDAGAHRYPAIFSEPEFAMMEAELYVRMLKLSEPKSILQWQLTSDYSLLAGGGVYGDTTPLRPTQRFWNIKQMASTPERVFHLPVTCGAPAIHCAALGNRTSGRYAVHVVNGGAARSATLTGLPVGVRTLRVWITDAQRGMAEGRSVPVRNGRATVPLAAASFTTLSTTR